MTSKDKIKEITNKLEQGVKDTYESENFKAWLDVVGKFHNYSLNNLLLIAIQKPEATRVAGFRTWQKLKRQVRKGEKGIKILAPCPHKKVIEDKDGNEETIVWTTFRPVSVFDISQTDGEELPDVCHDLDGVVEGFDELISKLESLTPTGVEYKKDTGDANGWFNIVTRQIVVNADLSEVHKVKTLVHELAHSILHDRENGTDKEARHEVREIQAESVAYTVCNWLGLDTSEYSFEYVATWSKGKEVEELKENMETIRTTAVRIIEDLAA